MTRAAQPDKPLAGIVFVEVVEPRPSRWPVGLGLLAAVSIGLVAAIPFLLPGFPAARDSLSHLFRLWAIDEALRAGDLYPRWLSAFVYGYGYPLLNFYGPLLYYLAEIPQLAGLDVLSALRLAVAGTIVLAAIGAYLLAGRLVGRAGGVVAAAVYVAAPYFQTDLLVRGAFPEALGIAILPWALLAVLADRLLALAIAAALLVLAHNAAALIGLPVVAGYLVWLAALEGSVRRLGRGVAGLALGLALSGFFWIPAVLELEAVALGGPEGRTGFLAALTSLGNLVQMSLVHDYREVPGAFLSTGLIQLALALFGLPFALRRGGTPFAVLLIVGLVLMTSAAAPIWERLPLVTLMAFPWRLQAAVLPATAVLAAGLATVPAPRVLRLTLAGAAVAVVLVAGLAGLRPAFLDVAPSAIDAAGFAKFERESGFIGTTSPVQFLPRGVETDPVALPDAGDETPPQGGVPPRFTLQADGSLRVQPQGTALVRLRQFFFPGWNSEIDGWPAWLWASGPEGIVTVEMPDDGEVVAFRFGATWPRLAGGVLSVAGLVALAAWRFRLWRGRRLAIPLVVFVVCAALVIFPPPRNAWQGFLPREGSAPPFVLLGVATDRSALAKDGVLIVRSLWQATAPVGDGWLAVVELTESSGALVAREERLPRVGTVSSGRWQQGDLFEDVQQLPLPPTLTAGRYLLRLGWRLPERIAPVETAAGEIVLPASAPTAPSPLPAIEDGRFDGDVRLVAGAATPVLALPLGLTAPWPVWLTDPRGRGALDVRLAWQADAPLVEDYGIFVIARQGGRVIAQTNSFPPLDQRYTSIWPRGRPVEQRFLLAVPALPEGPIEVTAGLFRRSDLARVQTVAGGDQMVVARLRREATPPAVRLDRTVGPAILAGYDRRDQCGEAVVAPCTLDLRLVWLAQGPTSEPLSVFLHLAGPDGRVIAQQDGPPNRGSDPTTGWTDGLVADPRTLAVPPGTPPGAYRMLAGLYRPGGARLPANGGDAVELFAIDVR